MSDDFLPTPLEAIKPLGRPLKYYARSGDVLLVLHLPRTTGTALFDLIAANFPADAVCSLKVWPQSEDETAAALSRAGTARVVRGYVDFEAYRHLPRTPIYFTMLRDPVDRVISVYHAIRSDSTHPHYQRVNGCTLHEFVCDPDFARDVENAQTRRLATSQWRDVSTLAPQTLIDMARVNLYEFAFFGIAERWMDVPFLLAYSMDWALPDNLPAWLPTPESDLRVDVSQDDLDAIRERNELDQQLYDDALKVFDLRCYQMRLELTAQSHLWNTVYSQRLAEYDQIRQSWSWRVLEKLKAFRRLLIPLYSKREQLYQKIGKRLFRRKL